MSPLLSIAIDAIHRQSVSGAKVPCWKIVGVVPGVRISYQRTPAWFVAWPTAAATLTVWVATIDSVPPPMLRYARRHMSRSEIASTPFADPDCGTQLRDPPQRSVLNGDVITSVGPVIGRVGDPPHVAGPAFQTCRRGLALPSRSGAPGA